MASKFQERINRRFALLKIPGVGWGLGIRTKDKILTAVVESGNQQLAFETNDFDNIKHLTETDIVSMPNSELGIGSKVWIDVFGPHYVVDVGGKQEDGKTEYVVAR